jgi:apolipoprotein D and lipocalin family protein
MARMLAQAWSDRLLLDPGQIMEGLQGDMMVSLLLAVTMAIGSVSTGQHAPGGVTTVDRVDLDRYTGQWYEIARFPNRFQRQCVGDVRATYTKRPDGRIDVVNQCRTENGETDQARGIARVVDEQTQAKLKVRFAPAFLSFLPFVWGDYWIVGLADDYSWATVGSPDREYLWILSRTPKLSAEAFEQARGRAAANGFDVGRLVTTEQSDARTAVAARDRRPRINAPVSGRESSGM